MAIKPTPVEEEQKAAEVPKVVSLHRCCERETEVCAQKALVEDGKAFVEDGKALV